MAASGILAIRSRIFVASAAEISPFPSQSAFFLPSAVIVTAVSSAAIRDTRMTSEISTSPSQFASPTSAVISSVTELLLVAVVVVVVVVEEDAVVDEVTDGRTGVPESGASCNVPPSVENCCISAEVSVWSRYFPDGI